MTLPFGFRPAPFLVTTVVPVVVIAALVTIKIAGRPSDGSMERSVTEKVDTDGPSN